MKINEVIELSTAFSAEVNVYRDFRYQAGASDRYIDGYLPNSSSRKIIKSIFETLSTRADRKLHLITASYGTGKSYLLLILAYLLGNKNIDFFKELERKLLDKDDLHNDDLSATLRHHWKSNSQYLVVIPKYGTEDFEQGMLAALNWSLAKNNITYIPTTNYMRAAEMLEAWKNINEPLYNQFQELLPNKNGEQFISLLKGCDGSSYITFKELFKRLFTDFSESHGNIYAAFQETAEHILTLGYKGIVTIYDEFGGILEKLVKKSELSSTIKIQEFLEFVKDKKDGNANLIFIAASHQDPSSLNENKQQSITKLLGRFDLYRLELGDNESEELIAEVFRKKDEREKDLLLNEFALADVLEEVRSTDIYTDKTDDWVISKIIKNLYPLHPLTAFILPRLSNQFAQNSRTMFNFLEPDETSTGSLRSFIENTDTINPVTGKLKLFTPNLLLTYFRPNLSASSAVSTYVDAFDNAMGNVDDPVIEQLFENLLILTVARKNQVKPTFEVMFNAMQFQDRSGFKNLLDDLVAIDRLELNPTDKVYEFPVMGSRNFSKVYEEEKKKLHDLNDFQSKEIWSEVEPLEEFKFSIHQEKYGADRNYESVAILSIGELEMLLDTLRKIYAGETKVPSSLGYVVYLLIRDEQMLVAFERLISGAGKDVAKYVIFTKTKDTNIFDTLNNTAIVLKACVNTANNIEIKANPNHAEKARTSTLKARSDLSNVVKQSFMPKNWQWSFDQLGSWQDIDNARNLDKIMDVYIEQLFSSTPDVKDDALWFGKSSTVNIRARFGAMSMILTAEKRMIPLYNGNNSSQDNRILKNLFSSKFLAEDTKTGPNIQYGEITIPKAENAWRKIWMLIDETLKINEVISPSLFILPLLKAEFGLSEHLIKFFFACYVRYNAEILIFTDAKIKFSVLNQSATVIDEMFKKPANYGIRKIEMSDFAKRYVRALHGLFITEGAVNSFENVSKRFENSSFFTALQLALIDRDAEVKKYYRNYLMPFVDELKYYRTGKEAEAKNFFMETLPPFIIPGITKELLENDNENIKTIVEKLKHYKSFIITEEPFFKLEVLRNLGSQVFDKSIATPDEFKRVVKEWFEQLSPNTKSVAKFENEKISLWLKMLRADGNADVLRFYLEELAVKPIKDWSDLFDDRSVFINTVRDYKLEIEEYKKSPIEVYEFIARACFNTSKTDCPTEQSFITLFQNWWVNVPQLNKEAQFKLEEVNIFIKEFSSSASLVQRLLIAIPIKWKDAGYLQIITNEWENWTAEEVRLVSNKYSEIVSALNKWEAPIPEGDFVAALGGVFLLEAQSDFSALNQSLTTSWLEKLPFNTRCAKWKADESESLFLQALKTNDSRNYFLKTLPGLLNYKEFRYWNKSTLDDFLQEVENIRSVMENYKRPMLEVIVELDKRLKIKSTTLAEFRLNLKEAITSTEAFKNNAEEEDGYIQLPSAITLLLGVRSMPTDVALINLLGKMATEAGIEEPYYLWLPETQTAFVKYFSDRVKYLITWKFPEEQLLLIAKDKIGSEIKVIQLEMQLSNPQLYKVLRDLINENTGPKT